MKRLFLAVIFLLLCYPISGQYLAKHPIILELSTISPLPTCDADWDGVIISIINAASDNDCTGVGTGTGLATCRCNNGSGWSSFGGGGGGTPGGAQYDAQYNDGASGFTNGPHKTNVSGDALFPGAGTQGVRIGDSASVAGNNAVGIGDLANAGGTNGVAIGYSSRVDATGSVAVGNDQNCRGTSDICIGTATISAATTSDWNVCIGNEVGSVCGIDGNVAIGYNFDIGGNYAVCIGHSCVADSTRPIAIGYQAEAGTAETIAIGYQAQNAASGAYNVLIGSGVTNGSNHSECVAIGIQSDCQADNSLNFGGTATRLISDVYFNGPSTVASNVNWHHVALTGSNVSNGSDWNWYSALGTGTGTSGDFQLWYAPPTTSGTTPHTGTLGYKFEGKTGHTYNYTETPTVASCGTGAALSGSDMGGTITVGTGTITSCSINFGSTATGNLACVVVSDQTDYTVGATTSASQLNIVSSADMATDQLTWVCRGY